MGERLFDRTRYLGSSDGFYLIASVPGNDDKKFLNVAAEGKALTVHTEIATGRGRRWFSVAGSRVSVF